MRPSPVPPAPVVIRQERAGDADEIGAVVAAAFSLAEHSAPPTRPGGPPGEVDLLVALRADTGWLPGLSLIACADGQVVGHVVCTRAHVDGVRALGLGPLSVRPNRQGEGIGGALVRAVLDQAAEAGESLVALLGDPAYYGRFGFVPARQVGVESPDPAWGDFFQARSLGSGDTPTGRFDYAAPFSSV
ncbi:GNAT family N-acetyltransferase [Nocardioides jensenii]|uniref:GNAT family N-acetyltransferase n=1 Tax=Nocardioides jensenii TaxID=1843 RepID=UPI00082CD39D|nr:N-acetyltransferase [Nocardioides jensenii]